MKNALSRTALALSLTLGACDKPDSHHVSPHISQAQQETAAATKAIIECKDIHELREERTFWATLKFKKSSFSLDIGKHVKNAVAAKTENIVIGKDTYDKWQIGQQLDDKFDKWGLIDGNIDSYRTSVEDKGIDKHWYRVDKAGKTDEIDEQMYTQTKEKCETEGSTLPPVTYENSTSIYVHAGPIKEEDVVESTAVKRCRAEVEVVNGSFSLSLLKHLRNSSTKQRFSAELPVQYCDPNAVLFSNGVRPLSVLATGRFSELKGHIVQSAITDDPNFKMVMLKNGLTYIVPTKIDN